MKKQLLFGMLLTVCIVIVAIVYAQVYPEGMVSYWKFDEGAGSTAYDSVDTNYGTLMNGAVWATGKVGSAVSLDGINDYIYRGNNANLKIYPPLSVEAWIYPHVIENSSGKFILSKGDQAFRYYTLSYSGDGILTFSVEASAFNDSISSELIEPDLWYHVVGVHDGSYIYLYINSDLVNSALAPLEPNYEQRSSNAPLTMGIEQSYMWNSACWFNGILDEVAIYNRALTPEEINLHYRCGLLGLDYETLGIPFDIKPGSCPNPLNIKSKGVLSAAILGNDNFDVTQIDLNSILLEGVTPLRSDLRDVATPYEPFTGKENSTDCTNEDPDGILDLIMKFDNQEIVQAIEGTLGRELEDGEVLVLAMTGNLREEFGGTKIFGEDVVVILKKGKK